MEMAKSSWINKQKDTLFQKLRHFLDHHARSEGRKMNVGTTHAFHEAVLDNQTPVFQGSTMYSELRLITVWSPGDAWMFQFILTFLF